MHAVIHITKALGSVNAAILGLCRWIGVAALMIMVAVILLQVFCRYVLNNALPWPDEAARFCMLWMTGLMAPIAFRRGGFVAIDMIEILLPQIVRTVLNIALLLLCLTVLYWAAKIGYKEVTGFSGTFTTASLYVPTSLDFSDWYRLPRSTMMASLLVGVWLMISVNIELLLRALIGAVGHGDALPLIEEAPEC